MSKNWNIKSIDLNKVQKITKELNLPEILAKLIVAKDIKDDEIEKYVKPMLSEIEDPFKIKDMDKFVDRVIKAIENKEKICIYGDYDVDGITSITIMYKYFKELDLDVSFYMPNRLTDGYGLNSEAIDEILEKRKVDLIITVDCGITAINECVYAKKKGIDVIVTDHHECAEVIPDAIAVINPKRKDDESAYKFHAGVGVAYKCLMALSQRLNLEENSYLKYLDIVALGTISDIVPLTGENRALSKYGLERMKVTKNVGLAALIDLCNMTDLDSKFVSFSLAPRINACGRMGKADIAVDMFLSRIKTQATVMADRLDELNKERQNIERQIFEDIVKEVEKTDIKNKSSIVLYCPNWHNGVLGIVASKLVNIYYKPVVLLTMENGVIRGSSRCPSKFSLYNALTKCSDLLVQFGGHELAAGLTIEEKNIEAFKEKFNKICKEEESKFEVESLNIDLEIKAKDINLDTIKNINCLKPYGQCNDEPLFIYKNLKINTISTVSQDKHLKLSLKDENITIIAMGFSLGNRRDELVIGDKIDIVGNLTLNRFGGCKSIQLIIKDFKKV